MVTPTTPTEHQEPQLLSRAELVAGGVSEYQLRCALFAGQLIAVTPGVYVRDEFGVPDPVTIHRAAVRAVLAGATATTAVSHFSAAVLHGLPLPFGPPAAVQVTRPPPAKSRAGARLIVHRRTVEVDEVVHVGGLPVTSVARTVVDCLLMLTPAEAIGLVRAGLETGLVTEVELADQFRRHPRVPGMRAAAAAVSAVTAVSAVSAVTARR